MKKLTFILCITGMNGENTLKSREPAWFSNFQLIKKVDIKTEAELGGKPNWIKGWDTHLLQTIKQDIMGSVGRTVY
ncbi:hypothetical protein D0T84_10765 [Dysgonomonas sp. 521]|uniref:hypothetical protein n=1 Tax=Dysgonomonas sp. 521 TaxID=2302932 RepID=UPI0013D73C47|nr:hypothetical protein [Dysgonomonas sp. 521]NDV95393.1 hypothetical protein [Dysgonomonas sp. 521]